MSQKNKTQAEIRAEQEVRLRRRDPRESVAARRGRGIRFQDCGGGRRVLRSSHDD